MKVIFNASFRTSVIFAVACLCLTMFVSCKKQEAPPQASIVKLKIGYIPIAECAHLYVGIAEKFFEREGIEVELEPMNGGAVILPAVQKGDLDIGFANVVSLISINSKLPRLDAESFVSLAGASYERPGNCNHALLIKHGSALTIKDLGNGKTRIAINTTRNIEDLMLRRFLVLNGVPEDRLNIVPLGFPDMLSALDRGDVDVVSEVEPFIEPVIRNGKADLLTKQYLAVSTNTVVATYAVTRQWLQKNPDTAARFIRAFKKADDFIKNNEAETRQILGSFTRITKEDLPIIGMPAFESGVTRGSVQELTSEMNRFGFVKGTPDPDDIITPP